MDFSKTDEQLIREGKFEELRRRRDYRTLQERNAIRERKEGQQGWLRPNAKREKTPKSKPLSGDYWKQRAIVAEAALRRIGGKPAEGPTFYESSAWQTLRYKALKLHGAKCQLCGAQGKLHVDHIKPRSKFPELELRLDNLQVLCQDCNLGKGAWDSSDWRKGTLKSIPGE